MGTVMAEAYRRALSAAEEFAREHPVLCTVIVPLIVLGILTLLVPWALEALGFGELGPIEGN